MHFLLDILFERADQSEHMTYNCFISYLLFLTSFFFFVAHVLAAEMKQILATVLTLIWK